MSADPIPRPLCSEDRSTFNARLLNNYARINSRPADHGGWVVPACVALAVLCAVGLHVLASWGASL